MELGDRYNEGKPMMSLVPPIAMTEVAKVLTYGAQKYAKNNWLKGRPHMEFIDSMERHVAEWKKCIDIDPESGLHHISHAACNLMMLLELIALRPDLDDRPLEFYNEKK